MFVRIKRIKGSEYGYLVENRWLKRRKGARQKVKGYLGKVYRLEKVRDIDFRDYVQKHGTKKNKDEEEWLWLLKKIIEWELYRHGFNKRGKVWRTANLVVDIENAKVIGSNGFKAALAINEGLLAGTTLQRLFNALKKSSLRMQDAYQIAKLFIECGIAVPKEAFVSMFKINKAKKS